MREKFENKTFLLSAFVSLKYEDKQVKFKGEERK